MVETNLETVRNPTNLFVGGCQWKDLEGLVNNFDALDFDSIKNSVVDAFKNI